MKIVIEIPDHVYEHAKNGSEDSNDEYEAMRAIAKGQEEHPHGKWIYHRYDKEFECSNCKEYGWITWNFCPICGSNNRREGDEK